MAAFYRGESDRDFYEKAGLDVTIKMGGPQVEELARSLLLAGETDFLMGYDIQVLKRPRAGNLPLVTVASSFQTSTCRG